jgi:hypothetical protein
MQVPVYHRRSAFSAVLLPEEVDRQRRRLLTERGRIVI